MATLFWAGNFVLAGAVVSDIHPITLNFWRWFISGLILFPFTIRGLLKHKEVIHANILLHMILGITGRSDPYCRALYSLIADFQQFDGSNIS